MILVVVGHPDRPEHAEHMESPHFQKAITALPRLLAAQPEIVNVEVPGGWARMSEMQVE